MKKKSPLQQIKARSARAQKRHYARCSRCLQMCLKLHLINGVCTFCEPP